MKKKLKAYLMKRKSDYEDLAILRKLAMEDSMYDICRESVDRCLEIDSYESGDILGISKTRDIFDALYEYNYCYRGGLMEIKVGEYYVIYGFEFD